MSSIWQVATETDRIDGLDYRGQAFWVEVKRDLNKGEQQRVATSGFKGMVPSVGDGRGARRGEPAAEPSILVDWAAQTFARVLEYLVDWSLADDKGNKLPLEPAARKRESVETLHPEVYDLIEKAITAHVERREIEKKVPSGEPRPRAISA